MLSDDDYVEQVDGGHGDWISADSFQEGGFLTPGVGVC